MSDFLTRHSRTILLNEINFEGTLLISKAKILLIGAGGLSSSIISILSASGVKQISIWEDDKLDISNLQRQFIYKQKNLGQNKALLAGNFVSELNSEVRTQLVSQKLSEGTFDEFLKHAKTHDIIIDATDSFASRVLSNKASVILKKPLFTGSAIGFEGHVYSFAGFNSQNPCYSCIFGSNYKSFFETKTCANSGVFPPIPSIIGSIIAQNALLFLATQKCDFTKFILVNFNKSNHFKEVVMQKDLRCEICANN